MSSKVTVLQTVGGIPLTKTYKSDGTTDSYGDAKSFKVRSVEVADFKALSSLLARLQDLPTHCIIRGEPCGDTPAAPGDSDGTWRRLKENFRDAPRHWVCIDVDRYTPGFADPVLEPELAVHDFIVEVLPPAFHEASFHWQLSSSAGMKASDKLKAHIWFWLEEPLTSAQLKAWGKQFDGQVDTALFNIVQVHFTAGPVFEAGRTDPVPIRMGWQQGKHDAVPLRLTAQELAMVRETGSGSGGEDMKLKDPREKPWPIGPFHQLYDYQHVIDEFLDGEVSGDDPRHLDWSGGGGTPGGVWVHDDEMHIGSNHNTWPIDGIANLWDVVRVLKFGHLDEAAKTGDSFEDLDLDTVGRRPSDQAMFEWATALPEMVEWKREHEAAQAGLPDASELQVSIQAATHWREAIAAAADELELRDRVCRGIREDDRLGPVEKDTLANSIKRRLQALGVVMGISTVRQMLQTAAVEVQDERSNQRPKWLQGYVYVTDRDKIYKYDSDEWLTIQGFDARFNRHVIGPEGAPTSAYGAARDRFGLPTVTKGMYWPGADSLFEMDGTRVVNLYRPSSVPVAASTLTSADEAAVAAMQRHIALLMGGRAALIKHFTQWLAHNVQRPGEKIRHSPLIKGFQGDGKSLLGTLLAVTMGQPNVEPIEPSAVRSEFNGWAEGSAVGLLEELKMAGHNRHDILNALKPCISNDTIMIHRKGKDPYSIPNMTNYLGFTNFEDALPIDDMERRWMIIFTPWSGPNALADMTAQLDVSYDAYFNRLHTALRAHGAALRTWLLGVDLTGFNRHGRAPDTDEKKTMVQLGVGSDELAIQDAIEAGGAGVCARVVSTADLSRLVADTTGQRAPATMALHRILVKIGYQQVPHQVKWSGKSRRVWVTTRDRELAEDTPEARAKIREILDGTVSNQIEDDFED